MDHAAFDRLARTLGAVGTRRAALGAMLGAGLAGTLGMAEAAKKDRKKRRNGKQRKDTAQVAAQAADCLSPGSSSNMNGCNFAGDDFSGQDLSGSSMVGTNFTNAELVGTKLHSSNMKNASFRGADLCGADLSSSTLRGADFRGFNPANGGRLTNLTRADLSSSGGCGTILTNQFTVICATTWCDGSVRNDDCPGGTNACCSDANCGAGEQCINHECVAVCDEPFVGPGIARCSCLSRIGASGFACVITSGGCSRTCTSDNDCTAPNVCTFSPCCFHPAGVGVCHPPCAFPDDCTCTSGRETCDPSTWIKCGVNVV